MKLFRAKSRQYEMIGVEFTDEGVALAHIERVAGQPPRLVHAEFIPCEAGVAVARLREKLSSLNLKARQVTVLMPREGYQLLLGEAPKVPAEQRNEALRWKVKDLVSFPVADAVIDSFLLNESCSRGGVPMAYVTVAPRKDVAQVVADVKDAGLEMVAIDIPELALARLVDNSMDTTRPVALVHLVAGGGTLVMVKSGELYLARNFKLDYNGGLLDDIPTEPLMLELQRSLDYFERQLRQAPASQILLCGENVSADKISEDLQAGMGGRIGLLDLIAVVSKSPDIEEHVQSLCMRALGAALREEAVS
ncbi:MSHA biogenesis protein MshI [Gilvimarinus sp. SDUM040013]|uniref:MSHA biogenesis protein MshI n=1 Tax=Gilvimarinus gilvus TaxID=3058038 RepID=A0ABU4RXP9_9GAMM|nr:MSHA biogenesis protein MshI [Gilvimarinus sp. SDUM040013]MDO3388184.1 MSHA biogenesis protein MshI [Gilvimarinus sp. SDUM040013]MDX6847734.1 MSHA biogenesis protein MshI [Gilvimarinus sp. SDUM040013]